MAVIGDGSLTGGMAYEGLNNAALEKGNLVIVINDNQWSIDQNVGGLTTALKKLRDSQGQDPENPFKAFGFVTAMSLMAMTWKAELMPSAKSAMSTTP